MKKKIEEVSFGKVDKYFKGRENFKWSSRWTQQFETRGGASSEKYKNKRFHFLRRTVSPFYWLKKLRDLRETRKQYPLWLDAALFTIEGPLLQI